MGLTNFVQAGFNRIFANVPQHLYTVRLPHTPRSSYSLLFRRVVRTDVKQDNVRRARQINTDGGGSGGQQKDAGADVCLKSHKCFGALVSCHGSGQFGIGDLFFLQEPTDLVHCRVEIRKDEHFVKLVLSQNALQIILQTANLAEILGQWRRVCRFVRGTTGGCCLVFSAGRRFKAQMCQTLRRNGPTAQRARRRVSSPLVQV